MRAKVLRLIEQCAPWAPNPNTKGIHINAWRCDLLVDGQTVNNAELKVQEQYGNLTEFNKIQPGAEFDVEFKGMGGPPGEEPHAQYKVDTWSKRSGGGGGGKSGFNQGGSRTGGKFFQRDHAAEEAVKQHSFAMSYAKDIVVAFIAAGVIKDASSVGTNLEKIANDTLAWLKKNATKSKAPPKEEAPADGAPTAAAPKNDAVPAESIRILQEFEKFGVEQQDLEKQVDVTADRWGTTEWNMLSHQLKRLQDGKVTAKYFTGWR